MTSGGMFVKETEPGSEFDDQATKAMGEAFEAACRVLDEAGQSSVAVPFSQHLTKYGCRDR